MSKFTRRLIIKSMDKERGLKVFLSNLKEFQAEKIRLELEHLIDKDNGSKAWFVSAFVIDEQNNALPIRYNCHINGKSDFYDVMSLLVDSGYEICVKTDVIKTVDSEEHLLAVKSYCDEYSLIDTINKCSCRYLLGRATTDEGCRRDEEFADKIRDYCNNRMAGLEKECLEKTGEDIFSCLGK